MNPDLMTASSSVLSEPEVRPRLLRLSVGSDRGFGPQRKRGRVERKVSVLNRSSKKAVYKVANP
jgi:hypothetical protein